MLADEKIGCLEFSPNGRFLAWGGTRWCARRLAIGDKQPQELLFPGHEERGEAWSIAVDAGYFDDAYWGEGWTWDAEPYGYQAAVTPIALDVNTVTVVVEPALAAGSPPAVRQIPRTSYVTLENSAGSVPDTPVVHPPEISRNWRERGNTITITGDFAASQGKVTERVSVWRPDLYCGTVLAEKLRTRGVPGERRRVLADCCGPWAARPRPPRSRSGRRSR